MEIKSSQKQQHQLDSPSKNSCNSSISTDENIRSNFSFRMFDLYRRFVDVVRQTPEFLAEFESGEPSPATCKAVVERTFLYNQGEERIANFVRYLVKNARVVAQHANHVPSNWHDAVKYTEQYIKYIRKYLHQRGMGVKNFDVERTNEFAEEIGMSLHGEPSEAQIEAIRDYLKYDLKNPKRSIINNSTPKPLKKKKSKLSKTEKLKNVTVEKIKDNNFLKIKDNNKLVFKISTNETPPIKSEIEDGVLKQINEKEVQLKLLKNESMNESEDISHSFCNGELEESVRLESLVSQIKLLDNKNVKSYLEFLRKDLDKSLENKSLNNSQHLEYLKHLLNESMENNNSYVITEENSINSKKAEKKAGEQNFKETSVNNTLSLKRKNSCSNEQNQNSDVKKFISNDTINTKNEENINMKYNNKDENIPHFKIVKVENVHKVENPCFVVDDENSNVEVIVDDNAEEEIKSSTTITDSDQVTKQKNERVLLLNINSNTNLNEENVQCMCKNTLINKDDRYDFDEDKYANVANMTYSEVQKLIEKVMTFCELKNEISLEEFLVLRRTRDKMLWRSLKEVKNIKTQNK